MGVVGATYEYAENPKNFIRFIDEYGLDYASKMLGYTPNSLRQMHNDRRKVRQLIEFACEQFYAAKETNSKNESIFFFSASPASTEYTAIMSVANALNVPVHKL